MKIYTCLFPNWQKKMLWTKIFPLHPVNTKQMKKCDN